MYRYGIFLIHLMSYSLATSGKIDHILEHISDHYVQKTSKSDLEDFTIQKILSALDPHSDYFSAETAKSMQEALDGEYQGLGMSVYLEDNALKIDTVLPNSPAQRAGLLPGDSITHINQKPIEAELHKNLNRLRQPPKGHLLLTLSSNEIIKIKPETISRDFLTYENLDEIGYIKIDLFTQKTPNKLLDLMETKHHEAYLIDLRDNPGGLLYAAIKSASLFLPSDSERIFTQIQNREGIHDVYLQDTPQTLSQNKPLYILIGPKSASGSELFSSILQHYNRATILGHTSRGKGSIQSLIPLKDNSLLKLTTAYFTSPDGTQIHEHGITPHIALNIDSETPAIHYIQKDLKA